MPITKSTFEGEWHMDDIIAVSAGREKVASKLKNPDGSPQIVTTYVAACELGGGRNQIQARAEIPKKVWRKVRKALAPYLVDVAVQDFNGTTKHSGIGKPLAADQD
jgi:hypothetical protein